MSTLTGKFSAKQCVSNVGTSDYLNINVIHVITKSNNSVGVKPMKQVPPNYFNFTTMGNS